MCSRYKIVTDAQALYDAFQVEVELDAGRIARYNAAPAADQLVILDEGGRRVARWQHWRLIPHWAKDRAIGHRGVNARAERVASKPAFRAALRQRRCLVPATGFYEWKLEAGGKQPYLIRLKSRAPFAFAGLWESGLGPEGELRSFAIITTAANALLARIHDRMPAIVLRAQYARWLDPRLRDPAAIQAMLASYPAEELEAQPIGRAINNARNEGPELIEAVGAPLS